MINDLCKIDQEFINIGPGFVWASLCGEFTKEQCQRLGIDRPLG